MKKKIYEALKRLKDHPFTIIGLSDREKFHTGMLAFAIRYYWKDEYFRSQLLNRLWPEAPSKEIFEKTSEEDIKVDVEKNSRDLIVANNNAKEELFAEVKFKTDIHGDQLKKYPIDASAIIGLFPPVFDPVNEEGEKYNSVSFSQVYEQIFRKKNYKIKSDRDKETLIRMWGDYLELINQVQKYYIEQEMQAIPDYVGCECEPKGKNKHRRFSDLLNNIKLRGIFERYRFVLIWKKLKNTELLATKDKAKDGGKAKALGGIFNTHGNAGIHLPIRLPSKDGKLRFSYGVQWQDSKLKLFIQDESYNKDDKSQITTVREVLLNGALKDKFYEYGENKYNDSLKDKNDVNPNKRGKFQSITLAHWDIFDDISKRSKELDKMIKFFSKETLKNKIAEELGE